MRVGLLFVGLLVSVSTSAAVYSYSAPASGYEFPVMTTVSATSGATTTVTTSTNNQAISGAQSQLVPLVTPKAPPPGPPTGTAILGQLVGAVAANNAANSTGNVAAINATQSNLINTEAAVMATGMTSVLNHLVQGGS